VEPAGRGRRVLVIQPPTESQRNVSGRRRFAARHLSRRTICPAWRGVHFITPQIEKEDVMKRFISAATLAAVVFGFAMLGLARPAAAGEQVRFAGTFDGQSVQTPAPPFVHDEITSAGQASQIGQFTMVISATVDPVARTGFGTLTFVAANGDTLTATTTGVSTPTSTPGVLHIVEQATITGGTGRFAGASGSFTIDRLFDRTTGAVTGTFEGSVSSPGAARS
jgi:hypothetical protein